MFSAQCQQTGRIMSTGRNSKTKKELVKALAEYLNSDRCTGDPKVPAKENVIRAFEFDLFEHSEELEDFD